MTTKHKPNAISYTRFSSKEQSKGDSYRRQTESTESYCQRHGLTLLDDFFDSGVSAFKGTNSDEGALRELIQRAKDGVYPKGTILIVESLDRISRQEINKALRLFLEILENGLDIVTLSDGERHYRHDKTELVDLIVSLVVLSRANEESEMKSQRIIASWKQRRKEASDSGKIITSVCPAWMKVENGKFKLIPDRVKLIKDIFKMSIDKNIGSHAIATILNEKGIKPWESSNSSNKSGMWSKTYITKLLCNKAVMGEHQPQKRVDGKLTNIGSPIKDYYPAIIDADYFNRNQSIREKRKRFNVGRPSTAKDYNLFKSLLFCSSCGSPIQMTSKTSGGKKEVYRYLFCSANCGVERIRYDKFEPIALKAIPAIDSGNLDGVNQAIRNRNETREGQIISKKAELKGLKDRWKISKSDTILELIEGVESEIADIMNSMETEQSKVSPNFHKKVKEITEKLKGDDISWRGEFRENITRVIKRIVLNTETSEMDIEMIDGEKINAYSNEVKPGVDAVIITRS